MTPISQSLYLSPLLESSNPHALHPFKASKACTSLYLSKFDHYRPTIKVFSIGGKALFNMSASFAMDEIPVLTIIAGFILSGDVMSASTDYFCRRSL